MPVNKQFDFGVSQSGLPHQSFDFSNISRAQLQYPLDLESEGALRSVLANIVRELNEPKSVVLASGATSFVVSSNVMVVSASALVTIATITEGYEGQILTLIFLDGNVTITDDPAGTVNTVNLSAAFTSTANDVMQLVFQNRSWREVSRSTN
jgi:hypothetical protein